MKFIEDIDVENKKVILRLDLNVTIKDNVILDETRIKKSIPTIKYLLSKNAHVLIMSHLGKIKSESDKLNNSLRIVMNHMSKLLGRKIHFVDNYRSDELSNSLDNYDLVMMENTRFADYPNNLESGCDLELSKYWASLGDIFINDAFGMAHRCHASNYGIGKFIPSSYGFLIKEELVGLEPVIDNIERPFTVIMGGAKVDDKIQLIKSIIERCDYLIVGGGIANTFLKAKGFNIGKSLCSLDYVEEIKTIIDNNKDKIWMPVDVKVNDNGEIRIVNVDQVNSESSIYDIGSNTIDVIGDIIKQSKTILLNGTMGLYEDKNYREGTEKLFQLLNESDATIIAGGGDALTSINELGYSNAFDFLSTGGGATLDYIANKKLKCFEGE